MKQIRLGTILINLSDEEKGGRVESKENNIIIFKQTIDAVYKLLDINPFLLTFCGRLLSQISKYGN